ncbi:hypothetical protein ElyMa_000889200 [Elysia marginata]|uniref:Uncharacterized protein n=1 Tax=Elysia marginata TaxID=1093978 RepID=A0AAV4H547_9GAST|nr:hypothetical protein ElyMa_000889200 [Elysia marginata]
MSFCPGEHAWPNTAKAMWDAHKKTITDPRCRDMLCDFYNNTDAKAQSLEKIQQSPTARAPVGVEQLTGQVSPYNSAGDPVPPIAAKKQPQTAIARTRVDPCRPPSQQRAPPICQDIVLPNPISRKSFEPWSGGPSKPCYRKRTQFGVYVGIQPMPETQPLDEETTRPWDNDTWIPPTGIFLQFNP